MILGKLCMETMRLESITKIVQPITARGPLNVDIEGIAYDSRQVREGYLFVALHGQHANGAQFIFPPFSKYISYSIPLRKTKASVLPSIGYTGIDFTTAFCSVY